jgi:hypothetical protein
VIVGVTGGRAFTARRIVWRVLDDLHGGADGPITDLVHGAAKGVDAFCDQWARQRRTNARWIRIWAFFPDFPRYGATMAPTVRNQEMVDRGPRPDVCLEFLGGSGTGDMVQRWRKAGFRILEVHGEGELHEKHWPQEDFGC